MNLDDFSADDSLAGQLLIASPQLLEPTFSRTVLLLSNHTAEEGALGYILNRPLDKTVGDLMSDPEFGELHGVPVFEGGPVSTEHLTFTSLDWNDASGKLRFQSHLSAPEANQHLKEGFNVRAFVGYSGWSGGQLEGELKGNAWVVREPVRDLLEMKRLNSALWGDLIRDISPLHRLAADQPDDLSLN